MKKVIAIIIIIMITNLLYMNIIAEDNILRIGLFYGKNAVNEFNIGDSCNIGVLSNGEFALALNIQNVIVSKSKGFHIQIGESFDNVSSANSKMEELRDERFYIAYITDKWYIMYGDYNDKDSAQKEMSLVSTSENVKIFDSSNLPQIKVVQNGSIKFVFYSSKDIFQIRPNDKLISIKENKYRGYLEVNRNLDSDMIVINVINIEDYLGGVVPAEIGSNVSIEAQKAQAVAARTYALTSIERHKSNNFHLCNSEHCQVYKGYNIEKELTNKAISETKGKRVLYNGKLAATFYFACSGGMTEDVENVWGTAYPYLKSVEDKYDNLYSKNYMWDKVMTIDDLTNVMNNYNYNIGKVISVDITKRSASKRVIEVLVKGENGSQILKLEKCRNVFGLKSQMYDLIGNGQSDKVAVGNGIMFKFMDLKGKKVVTQDGIKELTKDNIKVVSADGIKELSKNVTEYKFSGIGSGHGVGMSQVGAIGMAEAGFKFDEILKHYFTNVSVE